MDGARSRARSLAVELTSAWLAGGYDAVSSVCTPDVRWWTPAMDGTASGPTEASAALRQILASLHRPLAVTAVISSDDGARCVVEMRSATTPPGTAPVLVTSVITLQDGRISAGRTYTDLRGHGWGPHPDAS